MKKFPLLIATMLCLVAFTACQDDMDPPEIPLNAKSYLANPSEEGEVNDEAILEAEEDASESATVVLGE